MSEWRNAFCAGMLTSRALLLTSSTSRSSISSRSSGSMTHPRLLKLCRCEPAIATKTLRIITSLFCSASTTASWTHFIAVSKSTISPLRTPRDGVWPTPRILIAPSGRPSPTTTQIFEVPISRPIIKLLLAIVLAFSWSRDWTCFGDRGNTGGRFRRQRRGLYRLVHWNCLQNAGFHRGFNRVIDDSGRRLRERHGDVSLDKQIHRLQFLL